MKTIFISIWEQLAIFANNNQWVEYSILLTSMVSLVNELITRQIIELEISDNYNIIVYGVETDLSLKSFTNFTK